MIDVKDGYIPSPLIMFTCNALRHAVLEGQKISGIVPKASKSKLKVDRPNSLNNINYKNDGGMIASCPTATGRKLMLSPGVPDTDSSLMNAWNTLPESYQRRLYKNILATVKRQSYQAENPMPAMVICVEAAHVDNAMLLDYLVPYVDLEEPEIGSSDPIIQIDINCTDVELHITMPGGIVDYEDEGHKRDLHDAIPTAW
jgi:hypothetical protein